MQSRVRGTPQAGRRRPAPDSSSSSEEGEGRKRRRGKRPWMGLCRGQARGQGRGRRSNRSVRIPTEEEIRAFIRLDLGTQIDVDNVEYDDVIFRDCKNMFARNRLFQRNLSLQKHLAIVDAGKDGASFFKALTLSMYNSFATYDIVQHNILDFMDEYREHFMNYVQGNFDEYLMFKRTRPPFASNLEIQAAADLYKRPIIIYRYNEEHRFDANAPSIKQTIVRPSTYPISEPFAAFGIRAPKPSDDQENGAVYMSYHLGMYYSALMPLHQRQVRPTADYGAPVKMPQRELKLR